MNEKVKAVQEALRNGKLTPEEAAHYRSMLAGEYSFECGLLEEILSRKAAIWNTIRPNVKSDTAAERAYQATSDGLNEQGIRLRLKAMEKMMGALSGLLRLAEGQAKNLF